MTFRPHHHDVRYDHRYVRKNSQLWDDVVEKRDLAVATDAEVKSHTGNIANPHGVTKGQVGLGNVDNASDLVRFRSGESYSTASHGLGRGSAFAGLAFSNNFLFISPIFIPQAFTADRIGINVSTASATAGAEARLGIFTHDVATGAVSLVLDAGAVATGTTGDKEIIISQALDAGTYWLGFVQTGGASFLYANAARGINRSASNNTAGSVYVAMTYGTFAASYTIGAGAGYAPMPHLWVRST